MLKCTHDSGGLVIVKDKRKLDKKRARDKIEKCLKFNFYKYGREWPYKNVKPRIIAEKYMEDETIGELRDYKFFCFNGQVKCFKVDFDRFTVHRANYYNKDGEVLDFGEESCLPDFEKKVVFPDNLGKMKQLAEQLSRISPFLRVDFYNINGDIFFGETTFYPAAGFGKFTSDEWDYKLGSWIKLPKKTEAYL